MPGVAPRTAGKYGPNPRRVSRAVRSEHGLPGLARKLLVVVSRAFVAEDEPAARWPASSGILADVVEGIDEEVLRDVNEDRAISGSSPEVRGRTPSEEELVERRRAYRSALQNPLDTMDPGESWSRP